MRGEYFGERIQVEEYRHLRVPRGSPRGGPPQHLLPVIAARNRKRIALLEKELETIRLSPPEGVPSEPTE